MIFKKKQDAAVQQTAAGEAKPAAKGGKAAAFFRKNWKWMVPVVCVAVLGGWFILRPDKAQNANTDINYVQVSPSKRDVSNTLSGTGTLNPANTYNVKSLVAGKVLTSSFEEGDIVEEGTVLYTVDSSDATTKAEQASIALQQAQRSYDKTADRQYVIRDGCAYGIECTGCACSREVDADCLACCRLRLCLSAALFISASCKCSRQNECCCRCCHCLFPFAHFTFPPMLLMLRVP